MAVFKGMTGAMGPKEEASEPKVNPFAKKGKGKTVVVAKGKVKGKPMKGKAPPWMK